MDLCRGSERCVWCGVVLSAVSGFETEEELFGGDAEGKTPNVIFRHHSVAWNQDRERVGSAGSSYRTCGAGIAYALRQIRVGDGRGIRYLHKHSPYRLLKGRADGENDLLRRL